MCVQNMLETLPNTTKHHEHNHSRVTNSFLVRYHGLFFSNTDSYSTGLVATRSQARMSVIRTSVHRRRPVPTNPRQLMFDNGCMLRLKSQRGPLAFSSLPPFTVTYFFFLPSLFGTVSNSEIPMLTLEVCCCFFCGIFHDKEPPRRTEKLNKNEYARGRCTSNIAHN